MENNKIYSFLTKAAKEEYESKTTEFRSSLLERAFENAENKQQNVKEISLSDIIDAGNSQTYKNRERKDHKRYVLKKERTNRLITLSGVTYTIIGIGIYLYQNDLIELKNSLGLIIALVGILFTLFAQGIKSLPFLRYERYGDKGKNNSESKYQIVDRWGAIEKLGREIIKEKHPDFKTQSFSTIIKYLGNQLNEGSYSDLRKLLELRSKILHEDYNPSTTEIKWSKSASEIIIDQIENIK